MHRSGTPPPLTSIGHYARCAVTATVLSPASSTIAFALLFPRLVNWASHQLSQRMRRADDECEYPNQPGHRRRFGGIAGTPHAPINERLQKLIDKFLYGCGRSSAQKIRNFLNGTWLGEPLTETAGFWAPPSDRDKVATPDLRNAKVNSASCFSRPVRGKDSW
jgi:hypothetical protein